MMSCILPPSSCILHLTVPTLVCVVCPLNPFIFMSDDLGDLMKSCRLLVIDWLQQLSTQMSYESVSKCMIGLDFFLVDLASIVLCIPCMYLMHLLRAITGEQNSPFYTFFFPFCGQNGVALWGFSKIHFFRMGRGIWGGSLG